jgi:hypothetical protein
MPCSRLLEYCVDLWHLVAHCAAASSLCATFTFWLFLGPPSYAHTWTHRACPSAWCGIILKNAGVGVTKLVTCGWKRLHIQDILVEFYIYLAGRELNSTHKAIRVVLFTFFVLYVHFTIWIMQVECGFIWNYYSFPPIYSPVCMLFGPRETLLVHSCS